MKRAAPVQLTFDFEKPREVPKSKPCLNCNGVVKGWSKWKRICTKCKNDPEWRGAYKGLSNVYTVGLRNKR